MDSTANDKLVGCTTLAVGCIGGDTNTLSSGVVFAKHSRMVSCLLFTAIAISHLVYYPVMIEVITKRDFMRLYCNAESMQEPSSIRFKRSHFHISFKFLARGRELVGTKAFRTETMAYLNGGLLNRGPSHLSYEESAVE